MNPLPKRLIEVDLPIRRISAHARREKSIRHGHISTLHIWWARRPLAACRAVICAALWPDPADEHCPPAFEEAALKEMLAWTTFERMSLLGEESRPRFELARRNPALFDNPIELRKALLDFIADFANWDNSTKPEFLSTSRALTQAAHEALGGAPGTRPLVVDPFAGGGSIPLEALRVGADAFASDLNPIPVLLNKVVLEYIPKYGQRLADEVRKWGAWIKAEAEKELAEFYPKDPDGATPIAYLWARTIQCEGPGCGFRVPVLGTFYLRKKAGNYVKIRLEADEVGKCFKPVIITPKQYEGENDGTARRSSVTCPKCHYTTPRTRVEAQMVAAKGGATTAQLIAVVTTKEGTTGRFYRIPSSEDLERVTSAAKRLEHCIKANNARHSFVPDEELPYLRSIFNVHVYGIRTWGDLFSPRQQLAMGTLCYLLRQASAKLNLERPNEAELNIATAICLAFVIDKQADFNSSISRWANHMEKSVATFGRQALGILWDWGEVVPTGEATGSFGVALDWCTRGLEGAIRANLSQGNVEMLSATEHTLPNDSAACLVTDPPYYDAVPYADLADYFYVWLKRSLDETPLNALKEELSPKTNEVVQLAERNPKYAYKTKQRFEQLIRDSLSQGRRYVAPNGLGVVVFAHKSTAGWEAMLEGLIQAGWIVTASWPIDTEKPDRPRAQNSAALASSVHLVCRPRENLDGSVRTDEIGDWRDVLQELPQRIHDWMPRLAEEGVVGADAIFACLGPALEIFSRYSRVEKASGEVVTLKEYLEHVWAAVSKEALSSIIANADLSAFEPDARLTAMWLWTLSGKSAPEESDDAEETNEDDESPKAKPGGGFSLEYDAARKIAQGLGAHLEDLRALVEIKGDQARLLPVSERTAHLFGKEQASAPETTGRKKKKSQQLDLFAELNQAGAGEEVWEEKTVTKPGSTVLDRIHQSMILFATGRSGALKRFLVEDGIGQDAGFWKLAQALSALYPPGTQEKRWVDGVLARKKGLGL